jgi:hypothetical protein
MVTLRSIRRAWLLEVLLNNKALITLNLSILLLSRQPSDYSSPLWFCVIRRFINLISIMPSTIAFFMKRSTWNNLELNKGFLESALPFIGFRASKVDTSLFILFVGNDIFYLLVYVDDILLIGSNFTMLHRLIQLLRSEFKFRDLGTAHYFLGIEVQSTSMDLMLQQYKYTLMDTLISTSKAIILRILSYFQGTTTYGLHITRSFSFATWLYEYRLRK